MSAYMEKDPDAVLDYGIDWSDWLVAGDTIATSTWTITGSDAALVQDSDFSDSTVTGLWLSGGTVDEEYSATCHIVTTAGRADDRTLTIGVVER